MDKATLNPVLKDFWLTPARNKVLYGGRASSKSWDAAGFAIFLADNYKLRILCARQFQNKIEESVYSLLKIQIERFGLKHRFKVLDSKIINLHTGAEFLFYGLWRHISEVKSLESIDICWLEEAHNITEEQWEILEPTIRVEYSQFWVIFNPKLSTDFVYKRFVVNPPANTVVRKINYTENAFLSKTMLDVINAAKAEDQQDYEHVYLGVPKDDDEQAIIKRIWIMSAIDAHLMLMIEPTGRHIAALDVADQGDDLNAFAKRHGVVVNTLKVWSGKNLDIYATTAKALGLCDEHGADMMYYDADGLGAGVRGDSRIMNEERRSSGANEITVEPFRGSASVHDPEGEMVERRLNKDFFANLKAQSWWSLRQRFERTHRAVQIFKTTGQRPESMDDLISLSSESIENLDLLIEELVQPKYLTNGAGKILIDKQPDGTRSPNRADAVMICFNPSLADIDIWTRLAG